MGLSWAPARHRMLRPSETIHLAVACDRPYAMPLAAMLASLTAVTDARRPLVVHALGYDLSPDLWSRLAGSVPGDRVQWHRLELDPADLVARGFRTRPYEHVSPVTYARLLLPELLPDTVEKVLYLDSDVIICDDITPLWDVDIAGVDIAAVRDRTPESRYASSLRGIRSHRELGLEPEQPAFNSGVLLLNLKRWRETQVACRAFAYLRSLDRDVGWYEQEALNVVTNGNYLKLEPRWNVPPRLAARESQTAILHYLTAAKPWHWDFSGPCRTPFFDALDRTPWSGWRPARPRLGQVRRVAKRVRKALRKRQHALRNTWRKVRRRAAYRLIDPKPAGGTRVPPPQRAAAEIRLFLSVPRADRALGRVLGAYGHAGVDRAVILVGSGTAKPADLGAGLPMPVHPFNCPGAPVGHAIRRLLDRHGEGHWCLLGDVSGIVVDEVGMPVRLREYCDQLDQEGLDLVEVVTGMGKPLELITRDLRSGRVFRGSALARCASRAYDPPQFCSRVALVKYRRGLLMDEAGVLAGNARKSTRLLRFSPPTREAVP